MAWPRTGERTGRATSVALPVLCEEELPVKYRELPDLKPGEPCFILRGQDVLAPLAVQTYAGMLRSAAAGARCQIDTGLYPVERIRAMNELASRLVRSAEECDAIASQMIAWQAQTMAGKLPD
jgi:hypothetical protein